MTAAEVKQQIDIVEYISRTVKLVKRSNNYVGLCPFHDEKTPSFAVNPNSQIFKCFGCQASGDVISFYAKKNATEGDFKASLEGLCRDNGIDVHSPNDELYALMESLDVQFRRTLTVQAHDYIQNRNLSQLLNIGYCQDIQYTEIGDRAGLFSKEKQYPYIKGRLVFPICDAIGRVIAFTGRKMDYQKGDKSPKYINTADSPIFHKEKTLYNLHLAKTHIKKLDKVYVVEGTTDVSAFINSDYHNVVATCGTAFTEHHLKILLTYTSNIVFIFDGDSAGVKAMRKSLEVAFKQGNYSARGIIIPNDLDPFDYLSKGGTLAGMPLVSYLEINEDGSLMDKKQIMATIAQVDDMFDREQLVNEFCDKFRLTKQDIFEQIKFIRKKSIKNL